MSKKQFPIEPLDDRIVIERDETPTESEGGIVMPQKVVDRNLRNRGRVLAVGPGRMLESGGRVEPAVSVGDTVEFGEYAGTIVEAMDTEYVVVSEQDIFCILRGV